MRTEKSFYEIIFVVLVYKNIDVLENFFKTLTIPFSYKVVVVNSYFDNASQERCEQVANENHAVFLSIPNKGYSTGNNIGCEYANTNYEYDFLMISNSDIIIHDFDYLRILKDDIAVYAPDTKMLSGHRQNPNIPYYSGLFHLLLGYAYKYESDFILRTAHIVNRVYREAYLFYLKLCGKDKVRIFAPHGSFIAFTHKAVTKLMPIFNNEMFLYNEELYLAFHCKEKNVPIYYVPKLKLTHLEGASSTPSSNSWKNHKQSFGVLQQWLQSNHIFG